MTFQTLATLSGHLESVKEKAGGTQKPKITSPKNKEPASERKEKKIKVDSKETVGKAGKNERDFGLTVRIEINLPAGADKETYDKIFQSLRENILNAD